MEHLRASDAERERTVAQLRDHQLAGRLTVDEFDERCASAYAARTRGELAALTADLPSAPVPRPPAPPADPGGFGRRPFTFVFEYDLPPRATMEAALRTLAPALAHGGYELVARDERRLEFDYSYRPGWIAIPIVLMPIPGLLALLIKEHDRVVVDLEDGPHGGTRVVVRGRAPRRVRRWFAELSPRPPGAP